MHAMERSHHVTDLLELVSAGDAAASEELLPLVYEDLRQLARASLAKERPGQTLQPTALVHEAYLRLVGDGNVTWSNRAHFFGAAAIAIRRILVDRARHNARVKHGGGRQQVEFREDSLVHEPEPDTMLAIDEVLDRLEVYDPRKAQLVMLRCFAGLTFEQTAEAMGTTLHDVRSEWTYVRAWMHRELAGGAEGVGSGA
jgi:RNA polymerase sigma factor (TIGR02999 family)